MRAGFRTVPTADALRTIRSLVNRYIQAACPLAKTACRTFFGIDPITIERDRVKKPVNRTEWAKIPAKRTIDQHGQNQQNHQNQIFPCKQPPDRLL